MSAEKQLRALSEGEPVADESADTPQPSARAATVYEVINGEAYPMRGFANLSWRDRERWSGLVNELQRVSSALDELTDASLAQDDDWADPVEPPSELTARFARVHKQMCLFAFPTVPKAVWRQLDAEGTDEINRLAGRFLDTIRGEAKREPEGNG